ncbi:YlaF family protein [Bacillus sp. KH172YL63]|uniref:YlaF family protein n=1 Tax=Bacillus sp. KH172YL63 TaxID=2709784 RepID=UPI0013E41E77|nr:YlaF family protein [Bacillus sp. KH172YL63]BCB03202.1 hypothetical protein KH172YL63_13350 [Bacillus sp. KH172YL63]
MENIKWIFVFFSIMAAVSLMGIAVSISLQSLLLAGASTVCLLIVMGFGFKTKKRYRQEGKL